MTRARDMVNGFGVCHGGVAFSLADSAFAFACNTHGRVTVSIENTITYPKAISVGDVLDRRRRVEESAIEPAWRSTASTVRRGDEIVALFRGTVYQNRQAFLHRIQT